MATGKNKWADVFDAHPDATQIHIGTNANGEEQPFLKQSHALNFAGGKAENVKTIQRPTAEEKTAETVAAPAETTEEVVEEVVEETAETTEEVVEEVVEETADTTEEVVEETVEVPVKEEPQPAKKGGKK